VLVILHVKDKGVTIMDLSQVQKDEKVRIVRIDAPIALKKRLASLGVNVGKEVEVLEMTLQKNTIKLGIGLGSVALRLDEARCVHVEVCA
jgi:ferrous iron transport protein A